MVGLYSTFADMRQLVAILFADMTGYTSLMQENENLARQKRQKLKQVLEKSVAEANGKIFQYYGDGALNIFSSAIDAVRCAISIQHQLQEPPRVDVRISIHTGDVTIEEDAIYGDGVNTASRVESLAVPGSVFISGKVHDEIRNQDGISAKELGFFELKNIKEPVRIYALSNQGLVVPAREQLTGKTREPSNRLAVLPFVNMSADQENEFFSDGITEELLNALTKVEGLQVTSRTSVFAFKGKNDDVRDIASKLNVDKILEGSVRKAGNKVRITAQLINGSDGYHLWSESYDRKLDDIFEVQDEISSIIANRLRENMNPVKSSHLVKVPTRNFEAYTLYLKGLYYWNKLTPADTRKAIECFERALTFEPNYAQAYAMIAAGYSYLGATGQTQPKKAFEIVHRYADKALQLDNTVAESHIAKASAYLFYDWKWEAAHQSLTKAIELNPAVTEAHRLLGFYYIMVGKKEKAVEIMKTALEVDPLSPITRQYLGNFYIFNERYDDALRMADSILEMHPKMRASIELKAWATGIKGDWNKALELFREVYKLTNHPLKGVLGLGFAYGMLGMREDALECLRKMEQRAAEDPDAVVDADMAAVWFALGNMDKTFYHISKCIEKRTVPFTYFIQYPVYRPLRNDPRFEELKKLAGL